jgi:hypothetical protein
MPAGPTIPQRLRRIIWEHEGRELCSAEVGNDIRCDLDLDPYEAGIIKEMIETDTHVRILTQKRKDAIWIPNDLVTRRFYFED